MIPDTADSSPLVSRDHSKYSIRSGPIYNDDEEEGNLVEEPEVPVTPQLKVVSLYYRAHEGVPAQEPYNIKAKQMVCLHYSLVHNFVSSLKVTRSQNHRDVQCVHSLRIGNPSWGLSGYYMESLTVDYSGSHVLGVPCFMHVKSMPAFKSINFLNQTCIVVSHSNQI
jgi:hypothetical protein